VLATVARQRTSPTEVAPLQPTPGEVKIALQRMQQPDHPCLPELARRGSRPTPDERLPERVVGDVAFGGIFGCQIDERHVWFLSAAVVGPLRESAVVDLLKRFRGIGFAVCLEAHAREAMPFVDDIVIGDRGVQ
jgi:hypothetical protein